MNDVVISGDEQDWFTAEIDSVVMEFCERNGIEFRGDKWNIEQLIEIKNLIFRQLEESHSLKINCES